MILNETTLGDLCARVASGDEEARHNFDRHVLPVVEAIVGLWLSRQRSPEAERRARGPEISGAEGSTAERRGTNLLPQVAETICAQMIAQAANGRRALPPRRRQPARPRLAAGDTLSALSERHTLSWLVPWPA